MNSSTPGGALPSIDIQHLTKNYGSVAALNGLDLTVERGEVHGFLGPNGAGKSTTIRILLGLLRADSGSVHILGGDPFADAVGLHRRLAYVPGDVELWPNLTGGQAIDLFARLRGGAHRGRRAELCERFDLDPTKKGRTYSKGNRQKVALISALASDVELLLLDEPTAGLDPLMESVFQSCIREAKRAGRTVLLSSHILDQVEVLADRISIIRRGSVVESGTLAELRHLTRTTVEASTERAAEGLDTMPGVHNLRAVDERIRFDVDSGHLPTVMNRLGSLGVTGITAHPPTLEELLLRHYSDELDHGNGASDDHRRSSADTEGAGSR